MSRRLTVTLAEAAPSDLDAGATVTVDSDQDLSRVVSPTTLALLRTVATEEPASIRETARLLDRDVKNVHRELFDLEKRGIVQLVPAGRARRPRFAYDELVVVAPIADPGRDP